MEKLKFPDTVIFYSNGWATEENGGEKQRTGKFEHLSKKRDSCKPDMGRGQR